MIDQRDSGSVKQVGDQTHPGSPASTYEPPRLTPLGNARDLLAATTGTKFDAGRGNQSLP